MVYYNCFRTHATFFSIYDLPVLLEGRLGTDQMFLKNFKIPRLVIAKHMFFAIKKARSHS